MRGGGGSGGGQIRCIMGDVQVANCWFAADASAVILFDKTKSVSLSLGTLFSSKLGKKNMLFFQRTRPPCQVIENQ